VSAFFHICIYLSCISFSFDAIYDVTSAVETTLSNNLNISQSPSIKLLLNRLWTLTSRLEAVELVVLWDLLPGVIPVQPLRSWMVARRRKIGKKSLLSS